MSANQIKATVSDPVRISPEGQRNWFPRLFTLPDGRMLQFNVTVDDTTEALKDERGAAGRIADPNGQNWQEIAMSRHFCFPVTLKTGVVRGFSYIGWHRDDSPNQVAACADFDPGTLTWTERRDAVIRLPTRAVDHPNSVAGMEFDRTVMCEPDGTLLATMYGKLQGDQAFRVIIVRSDDEGATWDYVTTVAYDPAIGNEGYCEPVLARVADGSLLCVMRTGGYNPLYQSRSRDNGLTWDTPINLGVLSVDPDLCLMRNGVLAMSTGRPTVQLLFSLDGSGEAWTAPMTIFSGPRNGGRENSTCYTGLRETADGRLLLVYDTNSPGSPWEARDNQINAVFIDVEIN